MYLYNIAPERERQGACRRITERHSIGHEGRRVGRRVTVTDVTPHLFQAAARFVSRNGRRLRSRRHARRNAGLRAASVNGSMLALSISTGRHPRRAYKSDKLDRKRPQP